MQRVLIIGNCGAGKSTFARQLARVSPLPLVHLDREYWSAGWDEPAKPEWEKKISRLVAEPRWIMDGNYSSSFYLRFPRADTVIWLDAGRWTCLWRAFKRSFRYFGNTRPDMAEGCPERFSISFLHYVFFTYPARRKKTIKLLANFPNTVVILRSKNEKASFLRSMSGNA